MTTGNHTCKMKDRRTGAETPATFIRNNNGVAAMEFVLVVPILILMFFAAFELSNILLADRKVTSIASASADLVAQDTQIDNSTMADIFAASATILAPFDSTGLEITISSVISQNDQGVVEWSDRWQDGQSLAGYPEGAQHPDFPPELLSPEAGVIITEVSYPYTSPISRLLTDDVSLEDSFYARPRRTLRIFRDRS